MRHENPSLQAGNKGVTRYIGDEMVVQVYCTTKISSVTTGCSTRYAKALRRNPSYKSHYASSIFPLDIRFDPTLTCPKAYTFPLPSGPISWELPQAGDFVLFTMIFPTYLSYQEYKKTSYLKG